jgi:UDP-N-acetylmuramoyl-tripeptide--D-alanyl-D-alanine ligase
MSKFIVYVLKFYTKIYIKKNKIEVIAITGSAGKTTTKMITSVLVSDKFIYTPNEGYNTEIGVPLAIFNEKAPVSSRNFLQWLKIIFNIKIKILKPSTYNKIILEFGADKQGDISYLISVAKPKIAVVTTVLPVHLEQFGNVDAIAMEKRKIVEILDEDCFAILNNDDNLVREMKKCTKAKVITFGQKRGADLSYSNIELDERGFITFVLEWKNNKYFVKTNFIAPQLTPSILSGIAVGLCFNNSMGNMLEKLTKVYPEKGRMNLLKGINNSRIIDDSYNANPESTLAALEVLSNFKGRKIAVLGSMNELGTFEKEGHEQVAKKAAEIADLIIFVGENTFKYSLDIAKRKLNNDFVQYFIDSYSAGDHLKKIIKEGDTVLFKGSQNKIYTEEALKKVLFDPDTAPNVLVRQSKMWQYKKEEFIKSLKKGEL